MLQITSLFLFFLFFVGLGVGVSKSPPNNAVVYIDSTEKTYFVPPCMRTFDEHTTLTKSTIRNAYKLKLSPDPECRDTGVFLQDARSVSGQLLVKIGVLKPLKSRWNIDGSWNW